MGHVEEGCVGWDCTGGNGVGHVEEGCVGWDCTGGNGVGHNMTSAQK